MNHASGGADQCAGADQPARARRVPAAVLRRRSKCVASMACRLKRLSPAICRAGRTRRRLERSRSIRCWGEFRFATRRAEPPRVMFHYGFSAEMGGGEYDRTATFDAALGRSRGSCAERRFNALNARGGGRRRGNHRQRTLRGNADDRVNAGERDRIARGERTSPNAIVLGGDLTSRRGACAK